MFLEVAATDVLTPVVALAGAFIASITTLTVAMLRFGLGGPHNPGPALTRDDLVQCTKDMGEILMPELTAIRQEMVENGKVLAEIRGRLHNPGDERK